MYNILRSSYSSHLYFTNTNICLTIIHVLLLYGASAVAQHSTEEVLAMKHSLSVFLPRLTASLWPAVKPSSKIGHVLWYMWLLSWSTTAIHLIEHMIYCISVKLVVCCEEWTNSQKLYRSALVYSVGRYQSPKRQWTSNQEGENSWSLKSFTVTAYIFFLVAVILHKEMCVKTHFCKCISHIQGLPSPALSLNWVSP